jgi:tripeptidyl-peptidase-1
MTPLVRGLFILATALQCIFVLPASGMPPPPPTLPPELGQYAPFDGLDAAPEPWDDNGPAQPDEILPFRIGFKSQNFQQFEQLFFEISNPDHPSYGNFMTAETLDAILDPTQQSVDLVHSWLKVFGIIPVHDHRWMTFNLTISRAEILLQAKYDTYTNRVSNKTIIATLSCSIPRALKDIIDIITRRRSLILM